MNVENINEVARTVFKKDKNHVHIMDVPMFSIYIHKDLLKNTNIASRDFDILTYSLFVIADKNFPGQIPADWQTNQLNDKPKDPYLLKVEKELKNKFSKAKDQINDIGFSSAHANVLINDIDAAGMASYSGNIILNIKYMNNPYIIPTIVHEWAHLYMFNKSAQFKNAVKTLYKDILTKSKDKFKDPSINPFDIVKPEKLSRSEEDVILKYWTGIIKNIPFVISDLTETKVLMFSKHPFTFNLYHHLPHLIQFKGNLKDNTTLSTYNYDSISLPKDSPVYILKGSTGWIIGIYKNNKRYEIVCKPNELENYVVGTNTPSILPDIQNAISSYIKNIPPQEYSEISEKLHDYMKSSFKQMMSNIFAYIPSTSDLQTIKDYTDKYILPRVYDMINDPNTSTLTDKDQLYNYLWVQNPHKPNDTSIVKYIESNIHKDIQLKNLKQDLDKPDFTGPSFEKHRQILQKLSSWINEYGMSNNLELWSTAVEYFFQLPKNYKKDILKLMHISE